MCTRSNFPTLATPRYAQHHMSHGANGVTSPSIRTHAACSEKLVQHPLRHNAIRARDSISLLLHIGISFRASFCLTSVHTVLSLRV